MQSADKPFLNSKTPLHEHAMNKPNILLINTHDSGRFFGCYGVKTVKTPNIDRLAQQGVRFTNAFAITPICSPSRGAMMTGRYPQRNGLIGLTHHGFKLNDDERHAAQIFAESGWETHLFCFQHEVTSDQWQRLGYQHYHARETEEPNYPYMFKDAVEVAGIFADFVERKPSKPFFACIGFNETHTPFHFGGVVPSRDAGVTVPSYLQRDQAAEDHFAHLQGAIEKVDTAVGIILESLEQSGLAEDTLVVFYTDHGVESQRDKWTLYDPGIEIPFIFRWNQGGIRGGKTVETLFNNVNLLPTLLELSQIPLPENLDGVSFASVCVSPDDAPTAEESEPFFGIYYNGGSRCIRTHRYKLIRNLCPEGYAPPPPVTLKGNGPRFPRPVLELYDLSNDPQEFINQAENPEYAEIRHTLDRQLLAWMQETRDPSIC